MALVLDETFLLGIPTKTSATDPYANNVVAQLHMNGADGTTTFTDNTGITWTPSSATISTAQSAFGGASALFTGATNSFISAITSTKWDFGLLDFTIECWVYILADSVTDGNGFKLAGICGPTAPSTTYWSLMINGDATTTGTGIYFDTSLAGVSASRSAVVTISKNAWHHIAVSRNSRGVYFSIDGTIITTDPITQAINFTTSQPINVGRAMGTSTFERPLNGHIDEFRITKGVARYVSNAFTTDGTNSANNILHITGTGTNASTYIYDSSPNTKPLIAVGTTQNSTTQFKYNNSSLYIPGAGSYLATPYHHDFNLGLNDFTFETWVYAPSTATYVANQISLLSAGKQDLTAQGGGYNIHLFDTSPNVQLKLQWCGTENNVTNYVAEITGTTLTRNAWHHVAMVRASGVCYAFYDGVLMSTTSGYSNTAHANSLLNLPSHQMVMIGSSGTVALPNNWPMTGYIDDLRLTKGVARYTGTFTPPTELPTPTSNDIYTVPATALPDVTVATFATITTTSFISQTASANATYSSVDLTSTTSAQTSWDIVSQPLRSTGEIEIDLEYLADALTIRHGGVLLTTGTGTGHRWVHYRASTIYDYWQNDNTTAAWTFGASPQVALANYATLSFGQVMDRRILNIRWNSANYGIGNTIEMRIDGILTNNYAGIISPMRPGIMYYAMSQRLHSIKVWDAPQVSLKTGFTGNEQSKGLINLSFANEAMDAGTNTRLETISNLGKLSFANEAMDNGINAQLETISNLKNLSFYNSADVSAVNAGSLIESKFMSKGNFYGTKTFEIRGTLKIHLNETNTPVSRTLLLVEDPVTNTVIDRTYSNATTGAYVFSNLSPVSRYTVIAVDTDKLYNSVVLSNYTPTPSPLYANQYISVSGVSCTVPVAVTGVIGVDVGITESYIQNPANVSVILHGETYTDSGPKRLKVTQTKNHILTAPSKIGKTSFRSDFTQYASVESKNGVFDFGTGDFTIEFNLLINSGAASYGVLQYGNWGVGDITWLIYYSTGVLYFFASSDGANWNIANAQIIKTTPYVGRWHHVAVIKQSGVYYTLFNGVQTLTFANAASLFVPTSTVSPALTIGAGALGYSPFDGWIDEIIITKGTAKSHKTLTLNTQEYPTDQATILLVHANEANGSTTFIDSSTTNTKALTANGTAQISTAQSKFGGSSIILGTSTANYISGVASTDYILNKSLTIECWIYPTAYNANGGRILAAGGGGGAVWNSTTGIHWLLQMTGTGVSFSFWNGTASSTMSANITLNAWHHIAFTHDIYSWKVNLWVDGVLVSSLLYANTAVTQPTSTPILWIGRVPAEIASATFAYSGYIDEIKIANGVNFDSYFSRVTPANLYNQIADTQFYNTEVMLHGTTVDYSYNPKTITVGTGVTSEIGNQKIGSAAIKFNGESYITASNILNWAIGTGNFTIETWVYNTGNNVSNIFGCFYNNSNNNNVFRLQATVIGNSGIEYVYLGNSIPTLIITTLGSANAWEHIALSRTDGVMRFFINGILVASKADTSFIAGFSDLNIGNHSTENWGSFGKFTGYMNEFRFTLAGRYTSNFSPESFPYLDAP